MMIISKHSPEFFQTETKTVKVYFCIIIPSFDDDETMRKSVWQRSANKHTSFIRTSDILSHIISFLDLNTIIIIIVLVDPYLL